MGELLLLVDIVRGEKELYGRDFIPAGVREIADQVHRPQPRAPCQYSCGAERPRRVTGPEKGRPKRSMSLCREYKNAEAPAAL